MWICIEPNLGLQQLLADKLIPKNLDQVVNERRLGQVVALLGSELNVAKVTGVVEGIQLGFALKFEQFGVWFLFPLPLLPPFFPLASPFFPSYLPFFYLFRHFCAIKLVAVRNQICHGLVPIPAWPEILLGDLIAKTVN